jgi:hypothetical protein
MTPAGLSIVILDLLWADDPPPAKAKSRMITTLARVTAGACFCVSRVLSKLNSAGSRSKPQRRE